MSCFDFERLIVYQEALSYYSQILKIKLSSTTEGRTLSRQLSRSALSIPLNIAEGCGRTGARDKKRFYVVSRGLRYETVSILQVLQLKGNIRKDEYLQKYEMAGEIAKILTTMIKYLDNK